MTAPAAIQGDAAGPVVLFDGVCHFCAWSVRFVLERDRLGTCRFAPLQSETGGRLLRAHGLSADAFDSFVLIEGGRAWQRSDAALRLCGHLRAPWRWLQVLLVIPRFLRDPVYRFIAANRYRWFGKSDVCLVPAPEVRARFLD